MALSTVGPAPTPGPASIDKTRVRPARKSCEPLEGLTTVRELFEVTAKPIFCVSVGLEPTGRAPFQSVASLNSVTPATITATVNRLSQARIWRFDAIVSTAIGAETGATGSGRIVGIDGISDWVKLTQRQRHAQFPESDGSAIWAIYSATKLALVRIDRRAGHTHAMVRTYGGFSTVLVLSAVLEVL